MASIGLYGLLAYAEATRTREIGVRAALGASRRMVIRLIAAEGFALTRLGVAAGIPGALAAARLTSALLFGVAPFDAVTLCLAAGLSIVVGTAATLLPAYRASTIDPLTALRSE